MRAAVFVLAALAVFSLSGCAAIYRASHDDGGANLDDALGGLPPVSPNNTLPSNPESYNAPLNGFLK
jgi:uncharacterized lipoprotein